MVIRKKLLVTGLCIAAVPCVMYAQEGPDKWVDVDKTLVELTDARGKACQLADLYYANLQSGALLMGGGLFEGLGRLYKPESRYDFNSIYRIGFKTVGRLSMLAGLYGFTRVHYGLQQVRAEKVEPVMLSVSAENGE